MEDSGLRFENWSLSTEIFTRNPKCEPRNGSLKSHCMIHKIHQWRQLFA